MPPSGSNHLDIARDANRRRRQRLAILLPMLDFVADDAAQLGIHLFLALSMTDAAEVEIGAAADVALVHRKQAFRLD